MRASPKDLQLRPVCVAPAKDHVLRTHRRLKRIVGGMWSIGVYDGVELVGVAVVGRPNARKDDKPGRLQVLRVAVEEGNYNACSMLYGACARAAKAMGALDLWTFIHDDEPGTSLKAAGWICTGETKGGEWSRPSRARQAMAEPGRKVKWWAPWSAALRAMRSRDGA